LVSDRRNETRRGGDLLTTSEMGTTDGTRQMAPGICFHSVCVSSHTQNIWMVNTANCRKKKTAIPGDEGGQRSAKRKIELVHIRIRLWSLQGVIRTMVSTMEILAPLADNKLDVPGLASG
jgi:hypothetical protein